MALVGALLRLGAAGVFALVGEKDEAYRQLGKAEEAAMRPPLHGLLDD